MARTALNGYNGLTMQGEDVRGGVYRWALEVCWLAVVFLVPLFFSPLGHQVFVVSKASLFQFLVVAMLGFSVAHRIRSAAGHQGIGWKGIVNSPLRASVVAFGLVGVVATVLSITPATSFWGSYARKDGLLTLICWIIFFLIVAHHLRHRTQLYRAVYALLLSSGIMSLLGIMQYFLPELMYGLFHCSHGGRVFSTTGNPLALSVFLAMVIPLNLAFIANWSSKWWRGRGNGGLAADGEASKQGTKAGTLAGLVVLLVLQFWCLWLAQYSITMLLFLISAIVFVVLLGIIRRSKLVLGLGAICLVLIGVVAGLVMAPLLAPGGNGRAPRATAPITSTEEPGVSKTLGWRVEYWRGAVDILVESPEIPFSDDRLHHLRSFAGYGPETFIVTLQRCFPENSPRRHTHQSRLTDRPHNHYLYLAVTTGLLGLAAFVSILVAFFYLSFRYVRRARLDIDRLLMIAMVAGMVQYMADSLFNPSMMEGQLVFWLVLGLTPVIDRLTWSDERVEPAPKKGTLPQNRDISRLARGRSYLSAACAVLFIVAGLGMTVRPLVADMYLQKGLNLQAANSDQAVLALEKAVRILPGEPAYWNYLGAYSYYVARGVEEKSLKTEVLAAASTAYEEARQLEPYIAYRYYSLADVYAYWAGEGATGKWPTALSLYDKACELFPDDPLILNKWSLALIMKGDFSEARAKLDYAASIGPEWAETPFLSGLLLAEEGKGDRAAQQVVAPVAENPPNLGAFVILCSRLTVYDMVQPLGQALEGYAEKAHDEWIPHAMLGVTAFYEGRRDKSIEEFDTAMSLVPDEDVGEVFRVSMDFSRRCTLFRERLSGVAAGWRSKLSGSPEGDTLLQQLDGLVESVP